MKKYILLLLSIVLLISCNNGSKTTLIYDTKDKNCPYHSIIVDSCEYINASGLYEGLAHKGNCKFCKERRLKEMTDYYD